MSDKEKVNQQEETSFHKYLDAQKIRCPLPLLKTKKAISEMSSGEIVKVDATDAHAEDDLRIFCRQQGHSFLNVVKMNNIYSFYIKVK